MRSVCIYHSADLDGHCAGAIVRKFDPTVEMIPMDYGQSIPWDYLEKCDLVYMVDFSLQPWDEMVRLADKVSGFVWIDHHKSAIEDHDKWFEDENVGVKIEGLRSSDYAACELAWKYFAKSDVIPTTVSLIGRWDIWSHDEVPFTVEFQYGMRSLDTDPSTDEGMSLWRSLFNEMSRTVDVASAARRLRGKICSDGAAILNYDKVQNEKHAAACTFDLEFAGYKWIASNTLFKNSSFFNACAS
jgi:oligoribonuclease NrnB/cAMP/cGMP phosphodiesterase (DHH superfamily)